MELLHIAGSPHSQFYHDLSLVYARGVVRPTGTTHFFAVVAPDLTWRTGKSLDSLSAPMDLAAMLGSLPPADLVVPHLFCVPGMTTVRGFFEDLLGLPIVGSPARVAADAADKARTRDIVSRKGVRVARGELLSRGQSTTLAPPLVVKPNSEDNSVGISLVRKNSELPGALADALSHDSSVLVEEFIPGREIRTCAIARGGTLWIPAMIEYLVNDQNPIRGVADKLSLSGTGTPEGQSTTSNAPPVCPAVISGGLREQLERATTNAHHALGCRDYSLFDFRVHEDTGEVYLLEAGLFWAFSEISMISRMVVASGACLDSTILALWESAATRGRRRGS